MPKLYRPLRDLLGAEVQIKTEKTLYTVQGPVCTVYSSSYFFRHGDSYYKSVKKPYNEYKINKIISWHSRFKFSPDSGRVAALRPISLSAWQVKLAKYFSFIVSMERMRRFSRPSNNSSSSVDRRRMGPWNQISWKRKSSCQLANEAWGPGTT